MWPFRRKIAKSDTTSDPRSLESRMRALELDWEDTYERIRRVLQRLSKRAEVIERAEKNESARDSAMALDGGGNGGHATEHPATGRLSDRQKAIQQAILRRRGGQ